MRIVYSSFDRFPSAKGAATHIEAFVSALGKRFGRVDLLTVAPESMERPEDPVAFKVKPTVCNQAWSSEGVSHYPIFAPGENLFERVLSFRQQSWHWWRSHIDLQSDLLPIVHFRSIFEGYPIARDKRQFCSRLVFEVNGLPSVELKYRYPDVAEDTELLRKLRHQEDVCLAAADLIVTVSQVNAEYLCRRGVPQERICVIPNGVDVKLFKYQPPVPSRHDEIVAGSPLKMLFSGTLSAWQGVDVAVEALALFRRDFAATLTLVGVARPRQKRELIQRAWELGVFDHVQLLEPVSKLELAKLHGEADVIVAPLTRNDRNIDQGCCPLKVLEAMSCGVPLIASDLPVVRELAVDDVEALLVRPGSAKAIKDAMLRLRSDNGLANRLGESARRRVEQDFTWAAATMTLIEAYQRLIDTPDDNR